MRVLPLLLVVACAGASLAAERPARVANGSWGGAHVRLVVDDSGAAVEFDCAHGRLQQPLTLDGNGRFRVPGTLVREGGPVRKDDPDPGRPATYQGETDGQKMRLEVTLEDGSSGGTFSLTLGGRPRLFKCL